MTEARTTPSYVDTFASFRASIRNGDITIPRVSVWRAAPTECDHFVECIARNTPPVTSGKEGLAVVRVLEAMDRSAAAGGRSEPVAHD